MKTKYIITTIAVMLATVFSVRAYTIVNVTTNYSKFSAAIIVITNGPTIQASNLFTYPAGKAKITNKQLLGLFSAWVTTNSITTNWPSGARLIFDWESYQVCVADASGSNILMHCLDDLRTGLYTTNYTVSSHKQGKNHTVVTVTNVVVLTNNVNVRYLYVDWFKTSGAAVGTSLDANPGYDKWTVGVSAFFRLHDQGVTGFTDIQATGGNVQKFSQTWDASGNGLVWKDSETARFYYSGDNSFLNISNVTVSATLNASGSGKGYNPSMY
jgi:hypothetical protein